MPPQTAAQVPRGPGAELSAPGTPKPVQWWAALGAGFLALQFYVFARWIASGPERTPTGPTPVPEWMKVALRAWEVGGIIVTAGVLYWFVLRPCDRDRRLTFDGMLVLCMGLLYWQDPTPNYFNYGAFTYNSYLINFGSWAEFIPGWLAHKTGGSYAEPIIWAGPSYVYALIIGILAANVLMRRLRSRWPNLGNVGLVAAAYAFIVVFDFLLELVMARVGAITYSGAIKGLTMFHGHYYQFPVYESFLVAGFWTALACLRYFRDDTAHSFVERGVDGLRATERQRSALRFLALVGVTQIAFLSYNVAWSWFALHNDTWPQDVQQRSYFTQRVAGPGTDYAPPGPDVPAPRGNSAHVSPDGRLIVPAAK